MTKKSKKKEVAVVISPVIQKTITGKVFCDLKRMGGRVRFFVNKKYGNIQRTELEWLTILKKDEIV